MQENVTAIWFRLTPCAMFFHEYPDISFDKEGNIKSDLKDDLMFYKHEGKQSYELVRNFYKTLINFQNNLKSN